MVDTSVVVAGLRSRRGASYRLLRLLGTGRFEISISVPLVMEYESVLKRQAITLGLEMTDVDDIIDYICAVGERRRIHFLWRPILQDPSDDMVLELAVESRSRYIVTHNLSDFAGIRKLGVEAISPGEFLRRIEES